MVKGNRETKKRVKRGKSYGKYIPFVYNMLFLTLIFKHLGVEEAFQGERSLRKDKAVSLKSLVTSPYIYFKLREDWKYFNSTVQCIAVLK